MKKTLSCGDAQFDVWLRRRRTLCIAVLAGTLLVNLFLCFLRTDANAPLLKWLNIALDTIVGWLLFAYISLVIRPAQRKHSLAMRAAKSGLRLSGIILSISSETEHHCGLACRTVEIQTETLRRVYLPQPLSLQPGTKARLLLCDNIVVETDE